MTKKFFICIIIAIIIGNYYTCFASELNDVNNNQDNMVNDIAPVPDPSDPLGLASETAVLIDMNSGKVLYDKKMKQRMYPASITKILTAILVLENCDNLQNKTKASEYAVNSVTDGYTTAGIKIGEEFTIEELLEVMMLRSANEAATILAEYVSGSLEDFTKLMNEKAKEIGAKDSNFVNANGMHDENHYSTAYDMALIQRYCMQNEEYRRISSLTSCSLPNSELYTGEPRTFKNTHAFLLPDNSNYYKYAISGKTGFTTPAKNCLVTSANKDGFEIIAVILHAEGKVDGVSARYSDTKKLLDYGYKTYRISEFFKAGDVIDKIEIKTDSGEKEELNLVLEKSINILCKKSEGLNKKGGKIELDEISLPISKGDVLGKVTYSINDEVYTINLVAEKSIETKGEVKKVVLETDKTKFMIAIGLISGLIILGIFTILLFIIIVVREKKTVERGD